MVVLTALRVDHTAGGCRDHCKNLIAPKPTRNLTTSMEVLVFRRHRQESNLRPPDYKPGALPLSYDVVNESTTVYQNFALIIKISIQKSRSDSGRYDMVA